MVRLGIDSVGNLITSGFSIIGIRDISGPGAAANYDFNSVYIGGTGLPQPQTPSPSLATL